LLFDRLGELQWAAAGQLEHARSRLLHTRTRSSSAHHPWGNSMGAAMPSFQNEASHAEPTTATQGRATSGQIMQVFAKWGPELPL
jgi:hypothetical protein